MPVLAPDPEATDKRNYVRGMFSEIAPRYDLLNRVLSLNIDRSWRSMAIRRLDREKAGMYLDACAGTLDLSVQLMSSDGFTGNVVATDFALPMLKRGRGKDGAGRVLSAAADTLQLPFADAAFDGAVVGFGVRNLADLGAGFAELYRVLRPGGRLVILDFSVPNSTLMRAAYLFYFRRVLPLVGRVVSGHPTAYSYLPDSVMAFPAPAELCRKLEAAGFRETGLQSLTLGIAAVTWGVK